MQIPFRSGKGYTTLPAAVCRSLHPALRRRPVRSTGSFPRGKGAGTDQNTLRIKHTCKIGLYAYRYERPPERLRAVPGASRSDCIRFRGLFYFRPFPCLVRPCRKSVQDSSLSFVFQPESPGVVRIKIENYQNLLLSRPKQRRTKSCIPAYNKSPAVRIWTAGLLHPV